MVDKGETKSYNSYKLVTMNLSHTSKEAIMADKSSTLMYKGHPLRRKDNLIYYGSMADKYIIMIQVMSTTKSGDLEIADKVHLELQLTDPDLKSRDRVVKKTEKDNLYAAMDVAAVWLARALANK